ncbi:MAG: hypothetical protein AAGI01_15185, partial [Myxococcota bacterium]
MRIRLNTHVDGLRDSIAQELRGLGHDVDFGDEDASACSIKVTKDAPIEALTPMVRQLHPFTPRVTLVEELGDIDAELSLGDVVDLDSVEIRVKSNSNKYAKQLHEKLTDLGFRDNGVEQLDAPTNVLNFGGATEFTRQVVRWFLLRDGIEVTENKCWNDEDDDIYVEVKRSVSADVGPEAVMLEGDDFKQLFELKERLEAIGFNRVDVGLIPPDQPAEFQLRSGALVGQPARLQQLREALESILEEADADPERYPLRELLGDAGGSATIRLPLGALERGELPPYAGAFPERWDIVVRTDFPQAVEVLSRELHDAGYTRVRTEVLPEGTLGVRVLWGEASNFEVVRDGVQEIVDGALKELGAAADVSTFTARTFEDDDVRICIDIPEAALEGGDVYDRIREACSEWRCKIYAMHHGSVSALSNALRALSFSDFKMDRDEDTTECIIKYGGAPLEVVSYVADLTERYTGTRPKLTNPWSETDHDIWVYVPTKEDQVEHTPDGDEPDIHAWFERDEEDDERRARVFLSSEKEQVRFGHVTLRKRNPSKDDQGLVPRLDAFAHYCLDQRTAQTVAHLAESVALGEPCLLEGETSVSKTSAVQYLAAQINQPL